MASSPLCTTPAPCTAAKSSRASWRPSVTKFSRPSSSVPLSSRTPPWPRSLLRAMPVTTLVQTPTAASQRNLSRAAAHRSEHAGRSLAEAASPEKTSDAGTSDARRAGFEVRLANFTGPFDLLLGLISKHKLDITEVALATVTDEFIKYIRRLQELGEDWALDEASEFLVIAATLLDLKAARLLPAGEVEDAEDIALLEPRVLLFARLLQYKAFKHVAGLISETLEQEDRRYPRQVALEGHFAALLPELVWRHTPEQFAELAAKALKPKDAAPAEVGLDHLHAP